MMASLSREVVIASVLAIVFVMCGAGCAAREIDQQQETGAVVGTFTTEDLRGSPLYLVLPPDEIRSIDDPQFVPASEASFLEEDEPVLGVFDGQVAKAYSIWQLDHHEIVNDTLGGRPIAATW